MAKKASLDKVIIDSFRTIADAANINRYKIKNEDLATLGIVDSRDGVYCAGNGETEVVFDEKELTMLREATKALLMGKDPSKLFEYLRIKNPEYSEDVVGNDFFQTKYREITGEGKTILGYDHRIKALEQRFKPHVTTGKLRVMLDKQEVAPLTYMQILASAARTEKMYTETAQLREIFKTAQDELITGAFHEPTSGKELKLVEEKADFFDQLGVDVSRLQKTLNGSHTEDVLPTTADKAKYNMRYFDESLTDEGITRVAHAAKATYTTLATPFFESALGINLDSDGKPVVLDMRTVSAKNRDMLGRFLALKPKETFTTSKERIDSYARLIGTSVDTLLSEIQEPREIGHQYARRSIEGALGSNFDRAGIVLRERIAEKIEESSALASPLRSEFLRDSLRHVMDREFISENLGDYYFQARTNIRPVVDQNGNPTALLDESGSPVLDSEGRPITYIAEPTTEYQTMVFGDNNVYALTLTTTQLSRERMDLARQNGEHIVVLERPEGEPLGDLTSDDLEAITHYINYNADSKANLRELSTDDVKFGVHPIAAKLFGEYEAAQKAEMSGQKYDEGQAPVKATRPVIYRDLPQYKQYFAEAKKFIDQFVITKGGPVVQGAPYVQERVIEDPIEEPVDTKTDYENWKIIETTRKNYSGSLKRLTSARSEIKAEVPEGMDEEAFKQSEEYRQAILSSKAYRQADQNWVSFNENLSVVATGYLVKIFKNRDAELQPEEGEPVQTEYGIMANMFESVLKTRRLNEIQKGLKDGTYEPKEGEDVYTSIEEVNAAKESEILARYDLNTRLLELGKVDEMSSVLLGDKQPTAIDPTHTA